MADNTAKKQRGKPFTKGVSGNPTGRPAGALNKATKAAQALIDGESEALTRKAVDLALAGNIAALRLCLERLIPPRKERPLTVKLPAIKDVAELPRLTSAILTAVGKGELEAGQAAALASLVTSHGKVLEITEIERRLAALEKKR